MSKQESKVQVLTKIQMQRNLRGLGHWISENVNI
jgi:hypothetical protein